MTRQQFLERLSEVLETEEPLTGAERLKEVDGWDSMAALSFMALADEACHITVAPKDLAGCDTVDDLVSLVTACFEDADSRT